LNRRRVDRPPHGIFTKEIFTEEEKSDDSKSKALTGEVRSIEDKEPVIFDWFAREQVGAFKGE
jgi:hypothetical protein